MAGRSSIPSAAPARSPSKRLSSAAAWLRDTAATSRPSNGSEFRSYSGTTPAKKPAPPLLPSEGKLFAGDIDAAAISQAGRNAISAGVGSDIEFVVRNVTEWKDLPPYGCLVSNPPYGERLGTLDEAEEVYYRLGDLCQSLDTWSFYLLTAHREFESIFGWSADRRRKLYNAKIACTLYQYFGPKPPSGETR